VIEFWFPRAGVGTDSGNASSFRKQRRGSKETVIEKKLFWFPRAGVGTDSGNASSFRKQRRGSKETAFSLLQQSGQSVPTPARGNQKNRFPRRRVGTRKSWSPNLQIWKNSLESKPSDLEKIPWSPNLQIWKNS